MISRTELLPWQGILLHETSGPDTLLDGGLRLALPLGLVLNPGPDLGVWTQCPDPNTPLSQIGGGFYSEHKRTGQGMSTGVLGADPACQRGVVRGALEGN